jgi:hypothetical protein
MGSFFKNLGGAGKPVRLSAGLLRALSASIFIGDLLDRFGLVDRDLVDLRGQLVDQRRDVGVILGFRICGSVRNRLGFQTSAADIGAFPCNEVCSVTTRNQRLQIEYESFSKIPPNAHLICCRRDCPNDSQVAY